MYMIIYIWLYVYGYIKITVIVDKPWFHFEGSK